MLLKRFSITISLVCLVVSTGCHSSHDERVKSVASESTPGISLKTTPSPADGPATSLDFALTNYTGIKLRELYISPSDSPNWEENVLGKSEVGDGDTVNIRFSSEEKAAWWDLKVDDGFGHFAMLKSLNLGNLSSIKLRLDLYQHTVIIAEIK